MNRKVRFTIYGFLIMGILIWWWNIPQPVPQKPVIFTTKQPKVHLTDKMIIVKREDWTPEQEQLFKDYTQRNKK